MAIQRLLTVLAEMMDEKTDYDMQKAGPPRSEARKERTEGLNATEPILCTPPATASASAEDHGDSEHR